jgi:hypothetical protein
VIVKKKSEKNQVFFEVTKSPKGAEGAEGAIGKKKTSD